jgi:hypothetical protein
MVSREFIVTHHIPKKASLFGYLYLEAFMPLLEINVFTMSADDVSFFSVKKV